LGLQSVITFPKVEHPSEAVAPRETEVFFSRPDFILIFDSFFPHHPFLRFDV